MPAALTARAATRTACGLLPAVLLAAALAGCGASTAPDGTAAAPAAVVTAAGTALPDVRNATDLSKAPVSSAGHGTAPTGLVTRDLVTGHGTQASAASTVSIRYSGVLWRNGKEFDSTWTGGDGQPVTFPLAQTIPGFGRGISGMKAGGRRQIVIPPALGYGPSGGQPPTILADDTLVFVVDLIAVGAADSESATPGAGGTTGEQ
ncbi:FKBP-type peptidyl-prolyl cis-trans isomerase [Frankia sp. AgB32]|uniref:FKBP-type peptidyl-prolyl cis-trans isomerase n=1 Tax=Frankia sp. AgB32 TaxID=631119 RepID=UPI00200F2E52|nr:FKBP-type peptidyl-prolyl cis-trans isomerase [Frankia sp. AgB32]MCK9898113.1 FKBP-type peptidyl-prolyl cis-trans isomerase [Frankia sp. AgB32]